MRVIVFGATGRTGQHVLRTGLGEGHEVTAFGRSIDRIEIDDPGLQLHGCDVFDADSVRAALAEQDAAIVCLGSTGLRDKTTLSVGTKAVVDACTANDVHRLVVMSAAGAGESWRQIPWTSRLLFRTLLRNLLADHEAQEAIVEQSSLDWTIVRAAVLKDDPGTGHYTASSTGPITRINRADVAAALVDQLDDSTNSRRSISVTG
jgi:uncharacterized protein YbjT (DUF2867 family)